MSNYFDPLAIHLNSVSDGYFIFTGGRNSGNITNTMPYLLEFLFGGTCTYCYDPCTMIHHYQIKNDDIGYVDMTVTNECFIHEDINVRVHRMLEEYLAYMEYKYRDYIRKEKRTCINNQLSMSLTY